MSLVTLFSAGTFNGVITNTPSGTAYNITPNQIVVADANDVTLLASYGLIAFPPTLASGLSAPTFLTNSSGNFTTPNGITVLRGVMTGGGGGGGGVSAAAATASGGFYGVLVAFGMSVVSGQVIAYTCGAGGTPGSNAGGNGGTGGDTTFGPFTAKGGNGGLGSTSGNAATQGLVGTGTMVTGSGLIPSASAFITAITWPLNTLAGSAGTGGGARGIWGAAGTPGTNGSATDSTGYGAGGSGAGSTTNTAGVGGRGSPGAILLF